MNSEPIWLPPIVSVNGVWEQVLDRLYRIFDTDFRQIKRLFEGRPVIWDERILPGEYYEEGFWHLITRTDYSTQDRVPDFRRAERLPWCGPTISHSNDPIVKVWDYKEGNKRVRTYILLEECDYVVILEKRQSHSMDVAFLVTCFHIDGESQRRNLKKKYTNRIH